MCVLYDEEGGAMDGPFLVSNVLIKYYVLMIVLFL